MRAFLAAVSMLSCLPVGKFYPTEDDMRRSIHFFPAAGLLFGAIFYGIAWLCLRYFPHTLSAAFLTLAPEFLTKCFHLDGLADTADGFLSSRPRERKLEIMRDSHIGTMGVFAIVALLGMKFAALESMTGEMILSAVPLMLLNGRCCAVFYVGLSRYARPDGLGALFFRKKPWGGMISGVLAMGLCGWLLAGIPGLIASGSVILFAWIWSRVTKQVIGGATGDTIGASEELAELLTLLLLFRA